MIWNLEKKHINKYNLCSNKLFLNACITHVYTISWKSCTFTVTKVYMYRYNSNIIIPFMFVPIARGQSAQKRYLRKYFIPTSKPSPFSKPISSPKFLPPCQTNIYPQTLTHHQTNIHLPHTICILVVITLVYTRFYFMVILYSCMVVYSIM